MHRTLPQKCQNRTAQWSIEGCACLCIAVCKPPLVGAGASREGWAGSAFEEIPVCVCGYCTQQRQYIASTIQREWRCAHTHPFSTPAPTPVGADNILACMGITTCSSSRSHMQKRCESACLSKTLQKYTACGNVSTCPRDMCMRCAATAAATSRQKSPWGSLT